MEINVAKQAYRYAGRTNLTVKGGNVIADQVNFVRQGANGQALSIKESSVLLSGLSGATATATSLIPAAAVILGVSCRVTTLIVGPTTFNIGDSDPDRFGAAIVVAKDTTTTLASHTGTLPPYLSATATNVVLTADTTNFSAGAIRITVHYYDLTAATS